MGKKLKLTLTSILCATLLQFSSPKINKANSINLPKKIANVCHRETENNSLVCNLLFDIDNDGEKERIYELPVFKIKDYNDHIEYNYKGRLFEMGIVEDNNHFFIVGYTTTAPGEGRILFYWTGKNIYELTPLNE